MSISANCTWEFRTTGNNNNGGGYSSGGVDYSQQDSSILSVSDGATSGIGVTTLTSAIGGFTSDMIGNVIYLRLGTNVSVGWYEIIAYTNSNTVTLDRAPDDGGGGISSAVGEIGGARAVPTDAFFEQCVAGQDIYIKNGIYTLTESIDIGKSGTIALPISMIGYNTTRGDDPTNDNRPLIACGAYTWKFTHYWSFFNIRCTSTSDNLFSVGFGGKVVNCKSTNSSVVASREAFVAEFGYSQFIGCEAISTNGVGFRLDGFVLLLGGYIHDSNEGIFLNGISHNLEGIIIENIVANGIRMATIYNQVINGNTIDNCGNGIYSSGSSGRNTIINNNISNCTVGINWSSEQKTNYFNFNNYYSNGTDVINVTKGSDSVALNPEFTDSANGDFSIGTNLRALGFPGLFPGGLSTGYRDIGAVQRQEPTLPSVADVRVGIDRGDGEVGVLDLPSINDVQKGVIFDNTTKTGVFKSPINTDVRLNIGYGANDIEFTGTLESTDPGESNVIKDVTYKIESVDKTGTFDEAVRNTDPGESNVEDGVTYKIQNVDKEGNLEIPVQTDVRDGIGFGSNGTEKEGSLDLPSVQDVEEGVIFDNITRTGVFVVPSEANVKDGIAYGYNEEFTGALETGGIFSIPLTITIDSNNINVTVGVE